MVFDKRYFLLNRVDTSLFFENAFCTVQGTKVQPQGLSSRFVRKPESIQAAPPAYRRQS